MTSTPANILVIDDSAVVRGMLSKIIKAEPGLHLAGTAANGELGVAKAASIQPDIIVLDIEMPVMSGLEALVELRKAHPRIPIIMFSTLTEKGASVTLEALSIGASDYATKPTNAGTSVSASEQVRQDLITKIKALVDRQRRVVKPMVKPVVKPPRQCRTGEIDAVVLGSSTGGPAALEAVLGSFTAPLKVPMFIVQHMPPTFTHALAERLGRRSKFPVIEAQDGTRVEPGTCYIAPGGFHMVLSGPSPLDVTIQTNEGPRVKSCRPSVDVMTDSARELYGDRLVAVMLTGMGDDGADSFGRLSALGVEIIVQDEASSVVWGMPGAVAKAGAADRVLPVDKISSAIVDAVGISESLARTGPGAGR